MSGGRAKEDGDRACEGDQVLYYGGPDELIKGMPALLRPGQRVSVWIDMPSSRTVFVQNQIKVCCDLVKAISILGVKSTIIVSIGPRLDFGAAMQECVSYQK